MITLDKSLDNIAIIGCGGVTSWMIAPLVKLLNGCEHKPNLILIDGDTIEKRNLERQWFNEEHIGKNKAAALAEQIEYAGDVYVVDQYFTDGMQLPVPGITLYLGCADNHAARRAILSTVDRSGGWSIIAGNEYTEAEAYYYERSFAGRDTDPRNFYPAILTDNSGDPTRPRGCTGEAAIAAPQLVLANFSAANHLLWLLYHHFVEKKQNSEYLAEYAPVRTWNLSTKYLTTRVCDLVKEKAA